MRDLRQLKVWEKAHGLVLAVYELTSDFPKHELYGLTSEMRRAGASITANIAEGCGRTGSGDLHRFLSNGMGPAVEVGVFSAAGEGPVVCKKDAYERTQEQIVEVERMSGALIRKVQDARQV